MRRWRYGERGRPEGNERCWCDLEVRHLVVKSGSGGVVNRLCSFAGIARQVQVESLYQVNRLVRTDVTIGRTILEQASFLLFVQH
jgi:hypothetical protein